MSDIHSAATSPFTIDSDFRDVDSRPSSPMIATEKTIRGTDGDPSITYIDSTSDPEAQRKFNIRAHSIEVRAAHQQAIAEQTRDHAALQVKERAWNVIPIYHFSQRAKLYNAFIKAQIRFNKSTSLIRLQQAHADYLDALSRSSLSPEEQHVKYSAFKKALEIACRDRRIAGSSEELSIGCPSEFLNRYATKYEANKKAAIQSEKLVQKLLQKLQQPHTESRDTVARVLRYREEQLHHTSDKNSPEAQQLREEMKMIQSFQAAGGLDSLSSKEATKLNELFKEATAKYKIFQKASADYKQSTSPTPSSTALHQAEQDFKAADALVMAEIRKFGDRLKGPPQLRKELTTHLKHKEALKAATGAASVPEIDEEIATLKRFLAAPQLASLKPDQASYLIDIFQVAASKYDVWYRLDTTSKTLLGEATKAATEKPPKTLPKEKIDALAQAQKDASLARESLAVADKAIITKIRLLLEPAIQPPIPSSAPAGLPENLPPLPTDDYSDLLQPQHLASTKIISSASAFSAAATAVVTPSVLPNITANLEVLQALRAFVENEISNIDRTLTTSAFKPSAEKQAELKQQSEILKKFQTLTNETLPSDKIKSLLSLMERIQTIENKIKSSGTFARAAELRSEQNGLKNNFIAELRNILPPS